MSVFGGTGPAHSLPQPELEKLEAQRLIAERQARLYGRQPPCSGPGSVVPLHPGNAGNEAPKPNGHSVWNEAGFNKGPAPEFAGIGMDENLSDGIWPSNDNKKPNGVFDTSVAKAYATPEAEEAAKRLNGKAQAPSAAQQRNASAAGFAGRNKQAPEANAAGKPTAITSNFANIPAELTAIDNWVMWRYLPPKSPGQKWRKVPFQPNRKTASTTDPTTWSRFDECCAAYARGGFDGIGFVFDGTIGPDEHCYVGIDFDECIEDRKLQPLAKSQIEALKTYTEISVSGTGAHCITRAKPLTAKSDGVEIYSTTRFFVFTGADIAQRKIRAADKETRALAGEVRTAVKSKQLKQKPNTELAPGLKNGPAAAFAGHETDESLSDGIKADSWFEALSPEQKDEVVDYALEIIAANTKFLEIVADGGDNDMWYRLTTAAAVSDAPHAEDYFVAHALEAKNADTEANLRQHFSRCQADADGRITVGTLLGLAQQNGANFDQWKRQAPGVPALPPVNWSAAELQVSFSNIPHRRWLYGTYLIRGEITYAAAPGGVGKTAHAVGMAVEIATGTEVLGEKIWGHDLKVLCINAEDGRAEINRRVFAFCRAHAHKLVVPNLGRLSVVGAGDPPVKSLSFLHVNERGATVVNEAGFDVLKSALEALRPDVLILDPLVAFCGGGNMNDNAVMALVSQELKRLAAKFDCAILINHHTRKGSKGSDSAGEAEEISGASSIVNLAETDDRV